MNESRRGDIFQPGDLLNNTYRIDSLLGRGGTSEVYKARNEISGRFAAIKALKSEFSGNEDYLTLMTREEEIRDIRHDAVVRYSENHRTLDGNIYLVMDYVEGPGLDAVLRGGGMAADKLLEVGKKVAQGLRAAHARKIVHRDLSPDNIILRDGIPSEAVIIDFGIAKDTNPGAETIVGNEFAGKYAYAAPEQLSGQTDARSDLYSLGALLLATFRGQKPDIGSNPMEVVQKKSLPLDTEGVPEPLKSLIDRMADPIPDRRFQTADELLTAMAPQEQLSDATVIAPRMVAEQAVAAPELIGVSSSEKPSGLEPKRSRSGLWAVMLVLFAAMGGAGAYFGGFLDQFLGPRIANADPYTLIIEKPAEGAASAVGYVPTEAVQADIANFVNGAGGAAELSLATGDIADSWGDDVLALMEILEPVDVWRLAINGNNAQVTALANDRNLRATVEQALADGLPGALQGAALVQQGPLVVTSAMLQPVLDQFADCGRLVLQRPPAAGYGTSAEITITGRLAQEATRRNLTSALNDIAGDRRIVIDADVLNPTLCLIEDNLPSAPTSDLKIEFGYGDKPDNNPTGRYLVGENPVIDLILPANMVDGFLSVSILDVSGNVFHLLPNLNRRENDISVLRDGQTGPVPVRVAFGLSESGDSSKLAFIVDASSLGISKVVVLHSPAPLFNELRPTTESAAGYAEALRTQAENGSARIFSLDTRTLTTAR